MNIKLVAVDLDDTLLRRDKTISDYTRGVFRQLKAAGIHVVFATARSEGSSARFVAQIPPDVFIANGGALARQGTHVMYQSALSPATARGILRDCAADADVLHITLDAENGHYVSNLPDKNWDGWIDFAHAAKMDPANPPHFGDVYKFYLRVKSRETAARIAERYADVALHGFAGDEWYQLQSVGATKEAALEGVCAVLGVDRTDVAAFGDGLMDVGMLRAAGVGVAMDNASDTVKAAADDVCGDCDDDGVARWLEEHKPWGAAPRPAGD